jgi:outer membrane protein assembly factor BamB
VVSDTGFAVVSQFNLFNDPRTSFGLELDIELLPIPTQANFSMQGIAPNGEKAWTYKHAEAISWAGAPKIIEDRVYFAIQPYRIFILPPGSDDGTEPITDPGLPSSFVVCLDLESGELLWQTELPGFIQEFAEANEGRIYVSYSQILGIGVAKHLAALDAMGDIIWDLQTQGPGVDEGVIPQ